MRKDIPIIILAAGSSSRLGQSKQLVKSDKTPLLLKTVRTAMDAGFVQIIVVLGFNYDIHASLIQTLPVEILNHKEWKKGMGSSLKAGLKFVIEKEHLPDALVISVCDQPYLSAQHLQQLVEKYSTTSCAIVASAYNNSNGVPALFDSSLYQQLLHIEDSQGAKTIIQKNTQAMVSIEWPEGSFDIDTPDDLLHLN